MTAYALPSDEGLPPAPAIDPSLGGYSWMSDHSVSNQQSFYFPKESAFAGVNTEAAWYADVDFSLRYVGDASFYTGGILFNYVRETGSPVRSFWIVGVNLDQADIELGGNGAYVKKAENVPVADTGGSSIPGTTQEKAKVAENTALSSLWLADRVWHARFDIVPSSATAATASVRLYNNMPSVKVVTAATVTTIDEPTGADGTITMSNGDTYAFHEGWIPRVAETDEVSVDDVLVSPDGHLDHTFSSLNMDNYDVDGTFGGYGFRSSVAIHKIVIGQT